MSRIAVAISGQVLWSTGDVRLSAKLRLLLKDRAGNFTPEILVVDSGSEITTFPAYHARLLDLPMPAKTMTGVHHIQTGLQIRSGVLRFRVVGLDEAEYAIPCFFLGDPDRLPALSPATYPRKLLQPFVLLDRLRFVIDKDPASGSLYGDLVIESK
jgi:hypothetical protein